MGPEGAIDQQWLRMAWRDSLLLVGGCLWSRCTGVGGQPIVECPSGFASSGPAKGAERQLGVLHGMGPADMPRTGQRGYEHGTQLCFCFCFRHGGIAVKPTPAGTRLSIAMRCSVAASVGAQSQCATRRGRCQAAMVLSRMRPSGRHSAVTSAIWIVPATVRERRDVRRCPR